MDVVLMYELIVDSWIILGRMVPNACAIATASEMSERKTIKAKIDFLRL